MSNDASRWDGEDLKPGKDPDKDPHPEIKDHGPEDIPAQAGGNDPDHPEHPDHPDHPGDPDPSHGPEEGDE